METAHDGQQVVGLDLYRRWSVLARMTGDGYLAHPRGVKAFTCRRVKNDHRDAADLAVRTVKSVSRGRGKRFRSLAG